MISYQLYAIAVQRIDVDLELIRHALAHTPQIRELRESFIREHTKRYIEGLEKFINQKADRDEIDDLFKASMAPAYCDWVTRNFNALFEFSEARLNQMELVVRYALFETFLVKVIANILWDYTQLLKDATHQKRLKLKLGVNLEVLEERIRFTKRAVRKVDHLDYDELCDYLRDFLDLDFGQHRYASELGRIKTARDLLSHRHQDLILGGEIMTSARNLLSGFPFLLVQAASTKYPNSCTLETPEDDDDGTPGFELLDGLC